MTPTIHFLRAVGVLGLALSAPAARGANIDVAEAASERGRAAFEAGRFAEARDAFRQAVAALPVGEAVLPRTLYNLARAEQELGEHCESAERFGRYLELARQQGAGEKNRVEKAGVALTSEREACRAARAAVPAPGGTGLGVLDSTPKAPELAQTLVAEPPEPAEPPEAAEPADGIRPTDATHAETWPWVTAGGAVAFVVAGVVLNRLARDRVDAGDRAYEDFTASGRRDGDAAGRSRIAYDDAQTFGSVSGVGLGVGLALAGVSTWLFLRSESPASGPQAARRPGWGSGSVGVAPGLWRF